MNKPDLVVSFMREPVVRALLASRKLDVKNIISIRNDPSKEYPGIAGKLISKYILPKADGCVFQTEDAKKYFPIKLQGKSKIIFNQVDEKFFDVNIYDPKYIVSIGRLSQQKNQMMLINAFAKVNEKYPDEKLLIYGDGELKEKLKNEINKKGLEDRILPVSYTHLTLVQMQYDRRISRNRTCPSKKVSNTFKKKKRNNRKIRQSL